MKLLHWAILGAGSWYFLAGRVPRLPPVPARPLTDAERTRLAKLVPGMQAKIRALIPACAAQGVQLFIGSTDRTRAEQLEKIEQGRSGALKSWHLAARGADVYVIGADGKPDTGGKETAKYTIMGLTARKLGLVWLGTGVIRTVLASYSDPNHLQDSKGITWEQAMIAIGRSPVPISVA